MRPRVKSSNPRRHHLRKKQHTARDPHLCRVLAELRQRAPAGRARQPTTPPVRGSCIPAEWRSAPGLPRSTSGRSARRDLCAGGGVLLDLGGADRTLLRGETAGAHVVPVQPVILRGGRAPGSSRSARNRSGRLVRDRSSSGACRGPPASRRLRLGPGLLGSDPRDASRRREDAGVPVLPPDADTRRIFVEHLLDHSCPARL
jgi:hypothetical protein